MVTKKIITHSGQQEEKMRHRCSTSGRGRQSHKHKPDRTWDLERDKINITKTKQENTKNKHIWPRMHSAAS